MFFRNLENAQVYGAARSAILKPKDTLALSGAMNLSRSTEDLKPPPPNSTLGKIHKAIYHTVKIYIIDFCRISFVVISRFQTRPKYTLLPEVKAI